MHSRLQPDGLVVTVAVMDEQQVGACGGEAGDGLDGGNAGNAGTYTPAAQHVLSQFARANAPLVQLATNEP